MMRVWCGRAPALVGELLQLRAVSLELSIQIVVERVAVDINHKDDPFPCSSPLLDLLRKISVRERGRVRPETAKLYIPHMLLIYCLKSLQLPVTWSVGHDYPGDVYWIA